MATAIALGTAAGLLWLMISWLLAITDPSARREQTAAKPNTMLGRPLGEGAIVPAPLAGTRQRAMLAHPQPQAAAGPDSAEASDSASEAPDESITNPADFREPQHRAVGRPLDVEQIEAGAEEPPRIEIGDVLDADGLDEEWWDAERNGKMRVGMPMDAGATFDAAHSDATPPRIIGEDLDVGADDVF